MFLDRQGWREVFHNREGRSNGAVCIETPAALQYNPSMILGPAPKAIRESRYRLAAMLITLIAVCLVHSSGVEAEEPAPFFQKPLLGLSTTACDELFGEPYGVNEVKSGSVRLYEWRSTGLSISFNQDKSVAVVYAATAVTEATKVEEIEPIGQEAQNQILTLYAPTSHWEEGITAQDTTFILCKDNAFFAASTPATLTVFDGAYLSTQIEGFAKYRKP